LGSRTRVAGDEQQVARAPSFLLPSLTDYATEEDVSGLQQRVSAVRAYLSLHVSRIVKYAACAGTQPESIVLTPRHSLNIPSRWISRIAAEKELGP
jgi:hypothetical protein